MTKIPPEAQRAWKKAQPHFSRIITGAKRGKFGRVILKSRYEKNSYGSWSTVIDPRDGKTYAIGTSDITITNWFRLLLFLILE